MKPKIDKQSPDKPFTVNGKQYNSFEELFPSVTFDNALEWSARFYLEGHPITKCPLRVGNWSIENNSLRDLEIFYDRYDNLILRKEEQYPCFDSGDRMYEDRYYRLYIFCKDEHDAKIKIEWIEKNDCNVYNVDHLPLSLAPMVYMDDGFNEGILLIGIDSTKE